MIIDLEPFRADRVFTFDERNYVITDVMFTERYNQPISVRAIKEIVLTIIGEQQDGPAEAVSFDLGSWPRQEPRNRFTIGGIDWAVFMISLRGRSLSIDLYVLPPAEPGHEVEQ